MRLRDKEIGNGLFDLDRKPNPGAKDFKDFCDGYADQSSTTPARRTASAAQRSSQLEGFDLCIEIDRHR